MARFDAADLDVRLKADASHVTEADLATERAIRDLLAAERPGDGVLGEEYGVTGDTRRQWIIDPIDGTANYLKGIPMWTTLIALAIDGVPRVGVASQPAIGRRWWAATGHGAWTNEPGETTPRRISVSTVDDISRSSISFQSIRQWDEVGRADQLLALSRRVWRDRGYGDAWPYMLLAEGRLEFVAEFGVKEYDIAAHVPIITEAGGRFTDIDGDPDISSRSALATNGRLHETYLEFLAAPEHAGGDA
ncbi:histidinol phosphatase [Microbacterium oleivorans]|uniref:Histidinol phosphatase n=2 Tax=Microbacterium oleivorans TaxID=273677 RepID=A0A7D5J083_9MICO|nr:histidinol phosphatase [Microbacterium oleivorans]